MERLKLGIGPGPGPGPGPAPPRGPTLRPAEGKEAETNTHNSSSRCCFLIHSVHEMR